jgi:hypothetical protein
MGERFWRKQQRHHSGYIEGTLDDKKHNNKFICNTEPRRTEFNVYADGVKYWRLFRLGPFEYAPNNPVLF